MTMKQGSQKASLADKAPETGNEITARHLIEKQLRKWAGRGFAGGLVSTLLALPALAQASREDLGSFQFAEVLPGVRSVKLLENGDVQLKMLDGRTIVVAAEDVRVLDGGAIMIAEGVAVEIAQFAAAAEAAAAGAAAGGGVGAAGAVLGGIGLAGAAAAGGGGGGDESPEPSPTPAPEPAPEPAPVTPSVPAPPSLNLAELQGTALNSVSTGAEAAAGATTVEVTIGSVTTIATPAPDGAWSVSLTQAEAAGLPQGATTVTVRSLDSDGNEISVATADFTVDTIAPMISITEFSDGAVMNAAESGTDLTVTGITDAENGQTVTVNLNGQTYSGTVSGGTWSVTIPAADLTSLTDGAVISVTADVEDRSGNPALQATGSFNTDFTDPTVTLDPVAGGQIDLADVGADLTLTGTSTAEDGQAVTVTFAGNTYSGTVSGGAWSVTVPVADLATLSTGVPVDVSVTVDDAAGNPASPVSASVPVDLTGPSISIAPLSVGMVLNATETGSDLVISGTTGNVTDGQSVTVTLDGQSYVGTVSSGSWSVTVPNADLSALADGGNFTITADVTDADGLSAPQASIGLTKDATAPVITIDSLSDGAIMNAVEQATDLTISGSTTAETGQTVTVNLNGQNYTTTVAGATWSVTVPASDLAALADGTTFSVTADVSDAAGNPATQASTSFDTDFTAPTLAISVVSTGAVLNAAEQVGGLTISGTTDAPDGSIVSISIARADGTVDATGSATVSGGAWSFVATGMDVSSLQDAETYNVTATVTDPAGNAQSATTGFATDFSAPTIALDPLPVGATLDVAERGSDLTVSGSTTAEDGQTVTVSLNGQTYTGSANGGSWTATIPAADLAGLSDGGNYTVTATVEDAAGNAASATPANFSTDFRPILLLDPVGANDSIALADAQANGAVISGTSYGLAPGQSVDVTVNSNAVGAATVAADGSWSISVPAATFAGLDGGDAIDVQAAATVGAGPDPVPVSDQVFAHVPSAYTITEIGRTGSEVTLAVYADADRDISSGIDYNVDATFDPSVVTFNAGSTVPNPELFSELTYSPGPGAVNFAGTALTFTDLSQPLFTFTMTVQDPSQPIALAITTPNGGAAKWQMGTDGADILSTTNVDDVVRGGGGDDAIDLTGAGRDLVVFEADPAINGTDTITGFNLGPAMDVTDALLFNGLDVSTLRGSGTDIEILGLGGSLGANTGFVGLNTQLADLGLGTLTSAAEGLVGAQSGDEIYLMATDGTDSVLVKVDYSSPATASVDMVAHFQGLGDLGNLSSDNILHTDPTGATA